MGNLFTSARDVATIPEKPMGSLGVEGEKKGFDLDAPQGVFVNKENLLFVADQQNHQIQVLSLPKEKEDEKEKEKEGEGEKIQTGKFLFSVGKEGSGEGELREPSDVIFDEERKRILVVEKENCRVQVFDEKGTFVASFGGEQNMKRPAGIALGKDGNVFVSDFEENQVLVFDPKYQFLSSFGGEGEDRLKNPWGLRVLSSKSGKEISVCDYGNNRVCFFDLSGKFLRSVKVAMPSFLTEDPKGNLFVTSASFGDGLVSVFDEDLKKLKEFGSGSLDLALGIAIDSLGKVFVVDETKNKIFVF